MFSIYLTPVVESVRKTLAGALVIVVPCVLGGQLSAAHANESEASADAMADAITLRMPLWTPVTTDVTGDHISLLFSCPRDSVRLASNIGDPSATKFTERDDGHIRIQIPTGGQPVRATILDHEVRITATRRPATAPTAPAISMPIDSVEPFGTTSDSALFESASSALSIGAFDLASHGFSILLADHTHSRLAIPSMVAIGQIHEELGAPGTAAVAYEKARNRTPNDSKRPDLLVHLAKALSDAGDASAAASALGLLIDDYPAHAIHTKAYARRSEALIAAGRAREAILCATSGLEAISESARRTDLLGLLAKAYNASGNHTAAARAWDEAVALMNQPTPDLLLSRADSRFLGRDLEGARSDYRALLSADLEPEASDWVRFQVANSAFVSGDFSSASDAYKEYLESGGRWSERAKWRLNMCQWLDDRTGAVGRLAGTPVGVAR